MYVFFQIKSAMRKKYIQGSQKGRKKVYLKVVAMK